ncbi:UTP--glucose-1-phosphate uridylyltransferase [Lentisphaerota bacterium WC36G]|nr:UTP--glucose-1-phosphate uridylyltransferase [Lentisphaerae bacterium WC36]
MSDLLNTLEKYNQSHLMKYFSELNAEEQQNLTAELESINFDNIAKLTAEYVLKQPETHIPADLSPAPFFGLNSKNDAEKELYSQALEKGIELLKAGKVAALTVAGGQGTRLGYDGPKGTYPISPVENKTFFQYYAETILRIREKYNCDFKWYVMTSILNNDATIQHFEENNYFGLDQDSVMFFAQGTMPCIGYDGKLLLNSKSSLAKNPDGHGGTLLALKKSGALAEMAQNGVEYISYFQIDNPLVTIANELFIGLSALKDSEMSAIMLAKTNAFEKLGNFCVSDNKLSIIEYSDMPEELATATDENGVLKFIAGSPAIHIISREFVERLTADGTLNLPWHRADKKVPCLNEEGVLATPKTENAVKLEAFIFDALPLASKTLILEADRNSEFAPTKNQTGVDSVESCRDMLMERDAKWLENAGVTVPRNEDGALDCKIELSPLKFIDAEDVKNYCASNTVNISAEDSIYLS